MFENRLYTVAKAKMSDSNTSNEVASSDVIQLKSSAIPDVFIQKVYILKVDMKRKFLFSHMKVHEKQE